MLASSTPYRPPLQEGAFHERSMAPFNVEPKLHHLLPHLITPNHLLFHRNREPIPHLSLRTHADHADVGPILSGSCSADASAAPLLASERGSRLPEDWKDWNLHTAVEDSIVQRLGWDRWAARPAQRDGSAELRSVDLSLGRIFAPTAHALDDYEAPAPNRLLATIECAGNRRKEMNQRRDFGRTEGIEWAGGVVGCAVWEGVTLRSLLLSLGVPDPYNHHAPAARSLLPPTDTSCTTDSAEWSRTLHVHLQSMQPCGAAQSPSAAPPVFASSVPFALAMHPTASLSLCHSLNGRPLSLAHGAPLRAVVPAHAGARWVKWLAGVRVMEGPNESDPMLGDYKMLVPDSELRGGVAAADSHEWMRKVMGDKEGKGKDKAFRAELMSRQKPLMRLSAGSAVASPQMDDEVTLSRRADGQLAFQLSGYATGQEGSPIDRVEYQLLLPSDTASLGADPSAEELRTFVEAGPAHRWKCARLRRPVLEEGESGGWAVRASEIAPPSYDGGEPEKKRGVGTHASFDFAWTLWDTTVVVPHTARDARVHVVVRARTAKGTYQEKTSLWNVRGFQNRSWPVVPLTLRGDGVEQA